MTRPLSEDQKKRKAEYARQWRMKNPEKAREHARRTRAKNREKIRERQRGWIEKNREHHTASMKEWYQKNRDRVRERNWLKSFGITAEQYQTLFDQQGGRCGICGSDQPGKGEFFAVDHDHATGEVRGLLCVHCNVGLGHFRDDPGRLERAAAYLRDRRGSGGRPGSAAPGSRC